MFIAVLSDTYAQQRNQNDEVWEILITQMMIEVKRILLGELNIDSPIIDG